MEFPEHFLRRHVGFPTVLMLLLAGGCRQAETEQSSSSSAIETTSNSVTSHVRMLRLLEKRRDRNKLGSADLSARAERDRMGRDPQDEVAAAGISGSAGMSHSGTGAALQLVLRVAVHGGSR